MSACPVCGKGEYVLHAPELNAEPMVNHHVSHLVCVAQADKTMRVAVEANGRLEAENGRLAALVEQDRAEYMGHTRAHLATCSEWRERTEQAEVELAALREDRRSYWKLNAEKGQRCENCARATLDDMSDLPDHIWCSLMNLCWRKVDYCSRWQARP